MIKNQKVFLANRWTLLFIAVLYVAACGSVSVTDDAADSPAEIQGDSEAEVEVEEEETFDAVKEFEEVMTHFYFTHGNDLEAVVARLETLLEHDASFVAARFNLGLIAHLTEEVDEARRHYNEALELEPELVSSHINLGVLFAAQNNREEAQRHFEAALELEPDNWMARQNRFLLLSEDEDAIETSELELLVEEGIARWKRGEQALALADGASEEERQLVRERTAHAMFMVAEDTHEKIIALKVDATDEDEMQEQLREKVLALEKAQSLYEDVIAIGLPHWALAALYRLGEAFLHLAETIRQTPVPDGLSEENDAALYDHYALDVFLMTMVTSQDVGGLTYYTYKAALALFELHPEEYPEPLQVPDIMQTGPRGFVLSGFL